MDTYDLEFLESLLEKFVDELTFEDFIDLKKTMSQSEVNSYLKEILCEMINDMSKDILTPIANRKTVPLKKTYHLKLTVEREELTED